MKKAGDLFFYVLAYILKWIVVGYAHLFFSIRYAHRNRIPSRGGALVVINHTSFLDFVFAICTVPGLVKFVMNAHTYSRPLMRGLMRRFNFIPVQTAMGQEGRTKFNEAVKAEIEKGHVVVIFAEGTVSRTGQLLEFKKGVEHLSAMLNAPLIPVHFDNLPGSAFTFRAGKNRMERFTLRQWRRRVMIRVGVPVIGKITSFELRERMKELECESFSDRLDRIPGVMRSIEKNLRREPSGEWRSGEQSVSYAEWFASLAAIHSSLAPALQGESSVAVLLPPSADQMLINLYLFSRGFCIVNVDPSWGNEERWHVCRKTGVNTLITSRSYTVSKCGPVERQVIYMEDLHQACQQRKPVRGWC
ncbi:MAG: 1-acyl-sn-glycerol-3-phosphate acyltransferase, partial [Flavobacteriales bacterium]|nr:1-acyl-sn-glycerol-3-phosphate acyltransferase [Flavobacteriales bacterium]